MPRQPLQTGPMLSADGTPLKKSLQIAASPPETAGPGAGRPSAAVRSDKLHRTDRGHVVPLGRKRDRLRDHSTYRDRTGAVGLRRRQCRCTERRRLRCALRGLVGGGRIQDPYTPWIPAQLRNHRHVVPVAQDRSRHRPDGHRRVHQAVRGSRPEMGRSGGLGGNDAVARGGRNFARNRLRLAVLAADRGQQERRAGGRTAGRFHLHDALSGSGRAARIRRRRLFGLRGQRCCRQPTAR